MDQEAFALQPFDNGGAVRDDAGKGRMGDIDGPDAYQSVELCKRRFGCYRYGSFLRVPTRALASGILAR
jgi:hypothetical protein